MARNRISVQLVSKSKDKYQGFLSVFHKIIKEEGIKGLFQGFKINMVCQTVYFSTYLPMYEMFKQYQKSRLIANKHPSHLQLTKSDNLWIVLVSSCYTTLICDTLTYPLWLTRLKMHTQYLNNTNSYKNIIQSLTLLYKQNGLQNGLYKGLLLQYVGVLHFLVYFPIYEELKPLFSEHQSRSIAVINSSVIAKAIAVFITFPQSVLRNAVQF